MRKIIKEIMGWKSENTFYDWKRQNRSIISLLELIGEKRLSEFMKTGSINDLKEKSILSDEEHMLFNISVKFNTIPRIVNERERKSSWIHGLLHAVNVTDSSSKASFIKSVMQAPLSHFEDEASRIFLRMFIDSYISELECYLLLKNKNDFIRLIVES